MSQTAAVATTEPVSAKPRRLLFVAAALAVVTLLAGFVVIGYPLAVILGLAGTGAFFTALVTMTAADLVGGKGE